MRDSACLTLEGGMGLRQHAHMQEFNGHRKLQIAMLSLIDLGKGPLVQITQKLVVTHLLSDAVSTLTHPAMLWLSFFLPRSGMAYTLPHGSDEAYVLFQGMSCMANFSMPCEMNVCW